jgi:hypothetical protein
MNFRFIFKALTISFSGFAVCTAYASPPDHLNVKHDRSGKRYADRYTFDCTSSDQVWSATTQPKTRKVYVKNFGPAPITVIAGQSRQSLIPNAEPSSIQMAAGQDRYFGNPAFIRIECKASASVYAHLEWFK